jgi:hypothetical protein
MSDTEKKPKGWAEIKLRKVYMKEWKDRRDGADESDIISKRFYREREVFQFTFTFILFYDETS